MKEVLINIACWGGLGLAIWLAYRCVRSFVLGMIFMIGGK
jgi:hypothetical protein